MAKRGLNSGCAKTFGVALGGGGARGLAHILALETIDASGVTPCAIAGTSMGAIIGALYASGLSGETIRQGFAKHAIGKEDHLKTLVSKSGDIFRWLHGVRREAKRGGVLRIDGFIGHLLDEIGVKTFEDLRIPLHVVTTDFWSGEEVVFSAGELLPAIRASMAIPGIFAPVVFEDRVLVDGGLVNNVPFDILAPYCDCTIAIDVAPTRKPDQRRAPSILDAVLGMFDMLIERNVAAKLAAAPPTIYIRPGFANIRALDFNKHEELFRQTAPAMETLRAELRRVLAEEP